MLAFVRRSLGRQHARSLGRQQLDRSNVMKVVMPGLRDFASKSKKSSVRVCPVYATADEAFDGAYETKVKTLRDVDKLMEDHFMDEPMEDRTMQFYDSRSDSWEKLEKFDQLSTVKQPVAVRFKELAEHADDDDYDYDDDDGLQDDDDMRHTFKDILHSLRRVAHQEHMIFDVDAKEMKHQDTNHVVSTRVWICTQAESNDIIRDGILSTPGALDHFVECLHLPIWNLVDEGIATQNDEKKDPSIIDL